MGELSPGRSVPLSPELERLTTKAEELLQPKLAASTLRIYKSDFALFEAFCSAHGVCALPAEPLTVAQFIAARAEAQDAPTTLDRRLAAIKWKHQCARCADPTRHEQIRDIRKNAVAELARDKRQNTPFTIERLLTAVRRLDEVIARRDTEADRWRSDIALRDKAVFLVGFAAGFRPNEIGKLQFKHLHCETSGPYQGYRIKGMRTKNDKTGQRVIKGLPRLRGRFEMLCPVTWMDTWVARAKEMNENYKARPNEYVFRTLSHRTGGRPEKPMRAEDVARRVAKIAKQCGLEGYFRGHALRVGMATSADAAGVTRARIKAQTGHKSDRMLEEYIRYQRAIQESPLLDILGLGVSQQLDFHSEEVE